MASAGDHRTIQTQIPARMDRLPWCRWHWLIIISLGITWALDGLEVTLVGAIAGVITQPTTLGLSESQVGLAASIYILGAVLGSLLFGYLTDRARRKFLFLVTLSVYIVGTLLTAFSSGFATFALFRFITGMGIGGEYAAVNSAIDELIPARVRGQTDLSINSTYWLGAILGAAGSLILLNPALFPVDLGWRLAFGIGATLGVSILLVRRFVPENPRWLMVHGRSAEGEEIVGSIEREVQRQNGVTTLPEPGPPISVTPRGSVGFGAVARIMYHNYPKRSILGVSLMTGQTFFYNAIFFTYALVLTNFYGVAAGSVGLYLIPFAIGNLIGPWLLGRFFDTIGRVPMITFTYLLSGVLLAATGYFFQQGLLDATTQTIAWSVIFFFAFDGASSAYLTVSEVFPLELRAMAIAFFYSVGTSVGGILGPALFGVLIQTKSVTNVFYGYLIGAFFMIAAGLVELFLGVRAEQRPLESIAAPLSTTPPPRREEGGEVQDRDRRHGGAA